MAASAWAQDAPALDRKEIDKRAALAAYRAALTGTEIYNTHADFKSEAGLVKAMTNPLVLLLQIIASLKIFDQVFLMTEGGPGLSTRVLLLLVTDVAFTDYRVGAASAASVLLFMLILGVTLVRQVVLRRQDRKEA